MTDLFLEEAPARRRGIPGWVWVLIIIGGLGMISCAGLLTWVFYLGSVGPDTSVYSGKQVPSRFVEILEEEGVKEPTEELLFFYSDALGDIREGFYFVSDLKVAVYSNEFSEPLTTVSFDEIVEVSLDRDTSFFIDSQITLELEDGSTIWFPVSSEFDRDISFADAIEARVEP